PRQWASAAATAPLARRLVSGSHPGGTSMHKGHLTGCGIALGLALAVFTLTGGSLGGAGLLLTVLVCPLAMGGAMLVLMGARRHPAAHNAPPADRTALDPADPAR